MFQEHHIEVKRTARYFTLGTPHRDVKQFWICCHGYGQLAKNFIRKFDVLGTEDTFIIAPEGLSRFYWGGVSGEPVASWMTKEDRLNEIKDYTRYLSDLYDHYIDLLPSDVKVVLFGFSQGCATQMRWIIQRLPRFDQLILWGGIIPDDINYRPYLDYFSDKQIHFMLGDQDQFLTPEREKLYNKLVEHSQLVIERHRFNGKHVVDRAALQSLVAKL
jgi:predicted esterase